MTTNIARVRGKGQCTPTPAQLYHGPSSFVASPACSLVIRAMMRHANLGYIGLTGMSARPGRPSLLAATASFICLVTFPRLLLELQSEV